MQSCLLQRDIKRPWIHISAAITVLEIPKMAAKVLSKLSLKLSPLLGNNPSLKPFFFIPTILALITSLSILFYITVTSNLFKLYPLHHNQEFHLYYASSPTINSTIREATTFAFSPPKNLQNEQPQPLHSVSNTSNNQKFKKGLFNLKSEKGELCAENTDNRHEVFHDLDIFVESYKEMNRSLKVYVYPHRKDDPFAKSLLPVNYEPRGNYASESYFKKVLVTSHFITKKPSEADLFYMPFSIARLRHDPRVGTSRMAEFINSYIFNISHNYPFWNRTGGADHFYTACHSVGNIAMEKAREVKFNAIQVVCSSSYFVSSYVPHKDACLPQIWPRLGDAPNLTPYNRNKLAFFAGSMNSPVRGKLIRAWGNDSDVSVSSHRLRTPYAEGLLSSKFCLHVKGFEVNTARIGDALYYGCVPVIIANHYDLPFADTLNWKSFSVVVATLDIPLLKKVLESISLNEYVALHKRVLEVRKHFQWHLNPVDYDAFHMVMYELWLRRSSIRVVLGDF